MYFTNLKSAHFSVIYGIEVRFIKDEFVSQSIDFQILAANPSCQILECVKINYRDSRIYFESCHETHFTSRR
ncbi:MAG: hypothetical protein Solivirus1_4 [Solivirus sp.]|uniref:Uncharacterized protein n=1 Tax=Solivirus sp. TaxID=2487772 RepID=A0A3G5AF93_9VIRU|nr:MAG: hypothetical protein Solivirus1_4 [Solivirus sp.]